MTLETEEAKATKQRGEVGKGNFESGIKKEEVNPEMHPLTQIRSIPLSGNELLSARRENSQKRHAVMYEPDYSLCTKHGLSYNLNRGGKCPLCIRAGKSIQKRKWVKHKPLLKKKENNNE